MHSHQIKTFHEVDTFLHAGNARVTLVSKATGTRFTFQVKKADDKEIFFVSLLSGPDNTSDYQYMGLIDEQRSFRRTRNSRITEEAPSYKAFAWFYFQLCKKGVMPTQLEVWHEGRCGRCNRVLTVPESIENGIGPECAKHFGDNVTRMIKGEAIVPHAHEENQPC